MVEELFVIVGVWFVCLFFCWTFIFPFYLSAVQGERCWWEKLFNI